MVWIESHATLGDHPKTRKLARRLQVTIPQAIGHLHLLWWWAIQYAQDGDLSMHDAEDVAIGARWDGDSAAFVEALIECQFIDKTESGIALHDWHDYTDKLLALQTAGRKGNHQKWHVQRGITVKGCPFCEAISGGESGAISGGESGAISGATPPTSPTEPVKPEEEGGPDGRVFLTALTRKLIAEGEQADRVEVAVEVLQDQLNKGNTIDRPLDYARAIIRRGEVA